MTEAAENLTPRVSNSTLGDLSTREKVEGKYTDEIIIGICSPIGAKKIPVIDQIKKVLKNDYAYDIEVIKISSIIDELHKVPVISIEGKTEEYSKLIHKIKGGNILRDQTKKMSILAEYATMKINQERNAESGGDSTEHILSEKLKNRRKCYIIDSLKKKEEIFLLKSIYRETFYLFSIFSPEEERHQVLRGKNLSDLEITDLIVKDEYEGIKFGQDVRHAFVEADFFIRASDINIKENLESEMSRYISLMFESDIVTPYPHEMAMYKAFSAAGNSACLSRQVGASITDTDLNILSEGWNDVPKYGGGLYVEGFFRDERCMHLGYCSNDQQKDHLTEDIVNELIQLKDLKINAADIESAKRKIYDAVRNSKLKNLIEFSRSVHAEMHAIIRGAQLTGDKMIGGKLFCTTYPCHNCARHIIASGIKEVYYIEPYVKSLCSTLHNDAITEDENEKNKVKILIYNGVSPKRYLSFFSMNSKRKEKGLVKSIEKNIISPRNRIPLQALNTLELEAIKSISQSGILNND